MGVPESRRLKATPVIGANAAFNNRTKEELEMHMFEKNVEFPPKKHSHSLSLCGFGHFYIDCGFGKRQYRAEERGTGMGLGEGWGGGGGGLIEFLKLY